MLWWQSGHLTRSGTAGNSQVRQQSMRSDLETSIQEVMWPFSKTETYSEETNKYLYQDTKTGSHHKLTKCLTIGTMLSILTNVTRGGLFLLSFQSQNLGFLGIWSSRCCLSKFDNGTFLLLCRYTLNKNNLGKE